MTIDDLARVMNKTVNKLTTIIQQLCNLGMIIVKEDTIYIKIGMYIKVLINLKKSKKITEEDNENKRKTKEK